MDIFSFPPTWLISPWPVSAMPLSEPLNDYQPHATDDYLLESCSILSVEAVVVEAVVSHSEDDVNKKEGNGREEGGQDFQCRLSKLSTIFSLLLFRCSIE